MIFTLYPDQIIIDSNEDGFNEADVKSICKVGDSTKKHKKGYIGEKGIGFKSVFKVASVVHIQSGPFAFFFEHNQGESGMGMLTPFYEDPDENLPSNIRTRIRLDFAPATDRAQISQDFSDLPDSFLMFLSKVRKIIVAKYSESHLVSKNTYSYQDDDSNRRGTLTKDLESDHFRPLTTTIHYHITRRTLTSLPKDTARPQTAQVETILAFPLDSKSVPIIEQQYVFAYLPVRKAGFSVISRLIIR